MALSGHHAEPGPSGGDLIPATQFLPPLNVVLLHLLKEFVLPTVWRLLNKEL